ncbi:unnamed protein product [Peniophora sp. CBMAI 1063]|nr:unnamed protein product [Peniophora sp. CBMAI 1063]
MPINEVDAELLGVYLCCLTYGMYLMIFWQCVHAFYKRGFSTSRTYWLPIATLLIFIVTTIHLVTALIRAWQAFHWQPDGREAAQRVFQNEASLPGLMKNGAFVSQTIITDGIMVYRTYIVWASNWVPVIVPMLAFCADIAMGVWSMWTLAHTGVDGDPIVKDVVTRVKYFYVVTLVLNVVCAALIAFQIWRFDAARRRVDSDAPRRFGGSRLGQVVNIIIESAAIYCACLVILIATSEVGSDAMFAVLDMMPNIIAIIFTLIIVRVFRGTSFKTAYHSHPDDRHHATTGLASMRFGTRPATQAESDDLELGDKTEPHVRVELPHESRASSGGPTGTYGSAESAAYVKAQ